MVAKNRILFKLRRLQKLVFRSKLGNTSPAVQYIAILNFRWDGKIESKNLEK